MINSFQTMPLRFRVWDKVGQQFLRQRLPDGINIEYSIFELPLDIDCLDEDEKKQFIISQDTGLKDKNGKSIYTGDIVKLLAWTDRKHEVVRYSTPCRGIVPCVKGCPDCCNPQPYELEVIGNIWQNPELLEGK